MAQFDRVYQYKALFNRKRAVSKQVILDELEISEATFKRDLDKMRDFYNYESMTDSKTYTNFKTRIKHMNCRDWYLLKRNYLPC